ncbi:unnamed protein product [Caenorhabditis brenneri]
MTFNPILLILAVLVSHIVSWGAIPRDPEGMKEFKELQYRNFLRSGIEKKYVDLMKANDALNKKEREEAKGDKEKLKKAREDHQRRFKEMNMPIEQFYVYQSLIGAY